MNSSIIGQRRFDLPLESTAASRFLPWIIAVLVYLAVVALGVAAIADRAPRRKAERRSDSQSGSPHPPTDRAGGISLSDRLPGLKGRRNGRMWGMGSSVSCATMPREHVRCRRAAARALASIGLAWAVGGDPALGEERSAPAAPMGARLIFLGDTSFGENYQEGLAEAGGTNVLEELGYGHMMANFEALLRGASLVVANLETPVTDREWSPLRGRKRYIHHANVEETPRHLAGYGIELVSLANNHAMDYGPAGLADTAASLTRRGIATCGAGRDDARAGQPYRHAVRVGETLFQAAVICAFEYSEVHDRDLGFYAGADAAGVNPLVVSKVAVQVEALRREDPTVFVIAFPHWGRDYQQITANQRRLGRALVDAGVDLVIGHGAHLLQGLELYRGRWIAYGIGNFVFGSPGRYALFGADPYSAVAELVLEARDDGELAKKLRLYPIVTDNMVTGYRGRFVTDDEYHEVRDRLAETSALGTPFGAKVVEGRTEHGR